MKERSNNGISIEARGITKRFDDNVVAVARLVQVLEPDQFGKKPKPRKRSGRRDLTSEKGKERLEKGMQNALQKLFEAKEVPSDVDIHEAAKEWSATFICMDADCDLFERRQNGQRETALSVIRSFHVPEAVPVLPHGCRAGQIDGRSSGRDHYMPGRLRHGL